MKVHVLGSTVARAIGIMTTMSECQLKDRKIILQSTKPFFCARSVKEALIKGGLNGSLFASFLHLILVVIILLTFAKSDF